MTESQEPDQKSSPKPLSLPNGGKLREGTFRREDGYLDREDGKMDEEEVRFNATALGRERKVTVHLLEDKETGEPFFTDDLNFYFPDGGIISEKYRFIETIEP